MTKVWQDESLDEILTAGNGGRDRVEIECTSEKAAMNLRFALYRRMGKKQTHRVTVYGRKLSLVPFKSQITSIRRIEANG